MKPGFLKGETANKRCYSLVDERKKEKSRIGRSRFASVRITLGGFYLGENKRCPPTTRIMRLAEYCRPGGSEKSGQFLLFSDLLPLANISVNSRKPIFHWASRNSVSSISPNWAFDSAVHQIAGRDTIGTACQIPVTLVLS